MPIKILMPALSPTMTEGNLAKWLKKEGDKVKSGDIIAEIETDKATMEMEAADEGVLVKIVVPAGAQNIAINSLIAVILEEGEDASSVDEFVAASSSPVITAKAGIQSNKQPEGLNINNDTIKLDPSLRENDISKEDGDISKDDETRIFASPLAKRIAADKGINLQNIQGSGPHGRIIKADVSLGLDPRAPGAQSHKLLASSARNPQEFNITPHTNIRKIIARRLLESKQTVPHFYLSIECKLDKLLELRSQVNDIAGDPARYKLSVNDLIIKASALSLRDVPAANSSWSDEGILVYNNVDISVAVGGPNGLVTPILKNADLKMLGGLSNEIKELAARARENKLRPEEFQGGSFTISNLGMFGIKNFGAIINPPQSCILAVGEGSKRAVVEGHEVKIKTIMDVTLSCDHRVVDGIVGAQFLSRFKDYIENPVKMLANNI
jgi:pyruvate dehydrogenase E2 component (dihydrolipoamide acetyltransferase)